MPAPTQLERAVPARLDPRRSLWRGPVLKALQALPRGRLDLLLPGEPVTPLGAGEGPAARLAVHRERFFSRCALYGDIGFGEAYVDGDWDSPDLTAVIGWFLLNQEFAPTLSGSARAGALNLLRALNRLGHLLRPNSPGRARANIAAHYDLSNEFFALFLDPSMMYSCARWTDPHLTLEAAQAAKNEALCERLRLTEADHVLEIGTGWGGWALHAARSRGCRVTTITISRRQFELAARRVQDAGLAERVRVELRDYRDVRGRFDKLVSIEMMEALGHRYLPAFCTAVNRALRPGGLAALQFIVCPDARYERMRRGVDFIQKHIFPGSLLLSLGRVGTELARAGGLVLRQLDDLGLDYSRTLQEWRIRFAAAEPSVRALGFDGRFIRKWHYYLSYCEAAFARRNISVVQALYGRPNEG